MGVVMNMSSYEIERDSVDEGYGDEVMYAAWNPTIALVCQQAAPTGRHASMPADLVAVDAELFLQKMYACQR